MHTHAQLFSSPINVNVVGKVTAMAATGLVTKDIVNDGQPRKQGFFNSSGLPVEYDDIMFVDGTDEIETVLKIVQQQQQRQPPLPSLEQRKQKQQKEQQRKQTLSSSSPPPPPLWEGALIGKRPYLYPFPVAVFFAAFFWAIATEQFVQTTI